MRCVVCGVLLRMRAAPEGVPEVHARWPAQARRLFCVSSSPALFCFSTGVHYDGRGKAVRSAPLWLVRPRHRTIGARTPAFVCWCCALTHRFVVVCCEGEGAFSGQIVPSAFMAIDLCVRRSLRLRIRHHRLIWHGRLRPGVTMSWRNTDFPSAGRGGGAGVRTPAQKLLQEFFCGVTTASHRLRVLCRRRGSKVAWPSGGLARELVSHFTYLPLCPRSPTALHSVGHGCSRTV